MNLQVLSDTIQCQIVLLDLLLMFIGSNWHQLPVHYTLAGGESESCSCGCSEG